MAAKRFHIATPEQLTELAGLAKERQKTITNTARVWAANVRKDGKSNWDSAIYAVFSGDRTRNAEVVRFDGHTMPAYCGTLRYNLALNWCEQHLREVYD